MEAAAVQERVDALASLEERITRAVHVITNLRKDNEQLQQQLTATNEELASVKTQLGEVQSSCTEFEKENGTLDQRVKQLSEELEALRGERKQVRTRIEKLLGQLDLLSAS